MWVLAMGAALFGRWTAARALAAVAGAGTLVFVALLNSESLEYSRHVGGPDRTVILAWLASGPAWSLLLVAAPPDLLGGAGRARQRAVALAFLVALAIQASSTVIPGRVLQYLLFPAMIACVGLLCADRERLLPLGVALAFLPLGLGTTLLLILDSLRGLRHGYPDQQPYGLVLAAALVVCAAVAAVRLRRPRLSRA